MVSLFGLWSHSNHNRFLSFDNNLAQNLLYIFCHAMFAMAVDPRAEAIDQLMKEASITFRELAAKSGIDNWQNIRNWINGTSPRKESEIQAALNAAQEIAKSRPKRLGPMPMGPIRIVGNVAAGDGTYNVDSEHEILLVPLSLTGEDRLGWMVEGDSMMPSLEPGDVVVFKEYRQPRGKLAYLAKMPNGSLVCKQIKWNNSTSQWELHSINPRYDPIPMDGIELLGYMVGYYRVRGLHEKFESDPDGLQLEIFS